MLYSTKVVQVDRSTKYFALQTIKEKQDYNNNCQTYK